MGGARRGELKMTEGSSLPGHSAGIRAMRDVLNWRFCET